MVETFLRVLSIHTFSMVAQQGDTIRTLMTICTLRKEAAGERFVRPVRALPAPAFVRLTFVTVVTGLTLRLSGEALVP